MRALYLLGIFAFLLLGGLQAAYGPAFDAFAARFHVSREDVGVIASAHFLGTMLGVLLGGVLLARFHARRSLRLGGGVMALALIGVTVAPTWGVAVACALTAGVGFGVASATLNVSFARAPGAASALNLVNAFFGLGSVVAPLLVSALLGTAGTFTMLAVMSAALALGAFLLPDLKDAPVSVPGRTMRRYVALFLLMFVLYVGVEAGVGAWMTAHLTDRGIPNAAAWTSGFWLALTFGRLAGSAVAARVPLAALVAGAAIVSALGLALTVTEAAPVAYLLTGFALAPIFPTSFAWFGRSVPARLAPLGLASGGVGGTLYPALLGRVGNAYGMDAIPLVLAATVLATAALAVTLQRLMRTREPLA